MTTPSHRIFVSHSHIDNDFGTRLAQDLRRVLGDESAAWYDVLGLQGGETWWDKIVEELLARDVFIVVLSPDSMNSPWVRREINMALNEGKLIVPLLYRTCSIRADLRIIQIVSFLAPKTYEAAFRELLSALGLSTEKEVEPKKLATPPETPGAGLVQQMETAFAEQDWPDVMRKADYLIKRMPSAATASVYRMQGIALLEEGKVQAAQEALETALVLVSDRRQRLTLLSDYTALLAGQGLWDEVLQRAKEALRLVPNDPGWLATQQQAQSKLSGEAPVAPKTPEQEQTRSREISPTPQKTKKQWMEEGNAYYVARRYEEALAAYDQAIRLDPNDASAYCGKGVALRNLNHYQEALAAYEQAIRLNPNYALAYYNKGYALDDLKRYEEALAAYDQAIRLDPNYAVAYYNKGVAFGNLKRYEEALAAYDQAIRLDPNDAVAYYNKGVALDDLKRYEEALAAYEQAIRLDPNYADAYINKGDALNGLKRYEEALAACEQAIRLDPNDALAYINKGDALNGLKRYEEALAAYEQAIRLDPNDAEAYHNKGIALESLGRKSEAQRAYEKARQLGYSG